MAEENSIEQSFLRWCKGKKLPCVKLKLDPGRGWPDRAVLLPNNRVVWIEFKGSYGRLSPQQEFQIRRMGLAGHQVAVCNSVQGAIDAVTQFSEDSKGSAT